MRARSLLAVSGSAALAFVLSASTSRADEDTVKSGDVDGKPAVAKKDIHGYLVWHKAHGWRVVAGSTGRHHMKGRITIERGEGVHFKNVKQWKDAEELISEMENEDSFLKSVKYRPDERKPTELSFDIVSQENHTSGIDFEVSGPCHLAFELGLGGPGDKDPVKLDSKLVKIGARAIHPPSVPFQTPGMFNAEQAEAPPPPPAPAGDKVTGVSGRPADLGKGEFVGYDVWHSKGTQNWHLLVTTMEKRHHFKGRIWID
ncbi:hypothetical protein HY251_16400, partial [bacterium]|nr:hypothetical protein [bacterium]